MNMKTPRLIKIGDAISQLLNVSLLPNHENTTANESISGRSYRCGWKKTQKTIDFLFSPFEREHCKKAHESDIQRAIDLLTSEGKYDENS
jgi:hypothetical protein